MKKLYSIVLMAAALLIGTNAWADNPTTWDALKTALQAGGTVYLGGDIEYTAPNQTPWDGIWMGSTTESGEAKDAILNMNGHNITINSGKDGQALNPFIVSKGSLKVIGTGKIEVVKGSHTVAEGTNVFSVFGAGTANSANNPKGANPFTLLEIGADVTVETANGTVVLVDQLTTTHNSIKNLPSGQKPTYGTNSYAFGIRVDVKGTLRSVEGTKCYGVKANGSIVKPANIADTAYVAYIHIHPSALLQSNQVTNTGSAAAYPSGYAQWLIEGTCDGASGVYASGGKIEINNATIKSGATVYDEPKNAGHAESSGTAIVVNSRTGYPGSVELTITGDTKAESTSGYAFEEIVTTTDPTKKAESIVIEGGTFQGGTQGAIAISQESATLVEVSGGNVSGTANVGADDLATYLNNQGGTHTTLVQDEQGHTVLVISEGSAPDEGDPITGNMVSNQSANASVKWTVNTKDTIKNSLKLAELEINTTDLAQELVIKENATLEVGRVVLGKDAKIIVEAGAKFIVTGTQGIVAPVAENIVLKASETEGQAMFLFHPAVSSNRHPNATVEFISNSITAGGNYSKQRFAIPTFSQLSSMTTTNGGANVQTAMSKFYYDENKWKDFGWINVAGKDENLDQMATPFEYYQMQHNTPNLGTIVTMKGELYGNESPVFDIKGQSWNGFANSYMAPINAAKLIDLIPATVDKSFQIYEINTLTNKGSWKPVSLLELEDIKPMQAFLIRNTKAAADVTVNYEQAVYNPATPNAAPARRAVNNMTKAKLIVKGEGCIDRVTVAEDDQFSAEFDNGYDAAKYMNDGINMYVSAEEKMSIFATDNLENTYVGFQAVEGGIYTIEFAGVQGEELTLIDHETGAQVAMVEGNTYEFTANGTNDYRFEIVGVAKLPTAIENAEAVKSAKGIYTITGQYVGEMSVWNTLPAGIYVVNGEKLVK